jgi:hypothetical protein
MFVADSIGEVLNFGHPKPEPVRYGGFTAKKLS